MSNEQKNEQKQPERQGERQGEQRADRAGVILIELGNYERNTNPFLESANASYRGIYQRANRDISERMSFENDGVPDMPGFQIEIDVRNRRICLFDPLTRPQHKSARKQLEHHLENPPQSQYHIPKRRFTPLEDQVTEGCSNELMVNWLMELHRLVEAGDAQLLKGEFPKVVTDRVAADRRKAAEEQWGAKDPLPQLV